MQNYNISPWNQLQSVKTQLRDTESNMNDVLTCVFEGTNMRTSNLTLIGASGNIYRIIHEIDDDGIFGIEYKIYNSTTQQYDIIGSTPYPGYSYDKFMNWSNDITSTSEMLNDIANGMNANALIADICNQFQSNANMTLSDLSTIINGYSTIDYDDKRKIFNYCKQSMNNGTISNYGWISTLKEIFTVGQEAADDGTPIMDTSSPFVLQSITSTIMSVASTVLSVICAALSQAFGTAIAMLGYVLSSLFGAIQQSVSDVVSVDLNTSSYFVRGPVKYKSDWHVDLNNLYQYGIICQHYGPFDVFSWSGKPNSSNVRYRNVNAFLKVGFDVISAIKYLCQNRLVITDYSGSGSIQCYIKGDLTAYRQNLYGNGQMYLSQEDVMALLSNPARLQKYLLLCLWFHSVTSVKVWGDHAYSTTMKVSLDTQDAQRFDPWYTGSFTDGVTWAKRLFHPLWWHIWNGETNNITIDNLFPSSMTNGVVVQTIAKYYNNMITPFGNVVDINWYNFTNYVSGQLNVQDVNIRGHIDMFADMSNGEEYATQGYGIFEAVDNIPTDRTIIIPDVSSTTAILASVIIAATVSALIVATKATTKILNKRFTAKRLQDARNLSDLRRRCERNPGNSEYYDDYYKAIRRYNLKAKILGFSTYDPVNQWFNENNAYNGTLSAINTNNNKIPELLMRMTGTGNTVDIINDKVPTGASVEEIYTLIHGPRED